MAKNSDLYPFIAHGTQKMMERGIRDYHKKHHWIPEPNCKPPREEGQPLSMEKLASLFLLYLVGCTVSGIIFVMENIFKPTGASSKGQSQESQNKLEILKERLEMFAIDYEQNMSEVGKMNITENDIELTLVFYTPKPTYQVK